MIVLKSILPIYIVAFTSLYTLLMLSFGLLGFFAWSASLSLGIYVSARHVFKHYSLKFGGTVPDKTRQEAQDWWIALWQTKEVNP